MIFGLQTAFFDGFNVLMSFLAQKWYRTVMKSPQKASFVTKACKIQFFHAIPLFKNDAERSRFFFKKPKHAKSLVCSCNFLILFSHEWHQTFRTLMYSFLITICCVLVRSRSVVHINIHFLKKLCFFSSSMQNHAEWFGNYAKNSLLEPTRT